MSEEIVDYHPMWEEFGLDLEMHDALLGAVGPMYANAYLTQENRPEGPLVFAGGVAKNPAMASLISEGFGGETYVPDEAQIVGAYGAALSISNPDASRLHA